MEQSIQTGNEDILLKYYKAKDTDLSNKTGATIIITTHNNKNGLVYTGGVSNFQYVSLFYQLHSIKRENGEKALLLKCTKSRYGTLEQFTQGYEINFSAQTCTPERYAIINDDKVSELIGQVYNKANGVVKQIKENKKFELSRPEFIETIADTLKAGDKTAHEIATTLKLSSNYEQNFLKPILQQNLGIKWQTTKAKDKRGEHARILHYHAWLPNAILKNLAHYKKAYCKNLRNALSQTTIISAFKPFTTLFKFEKRFISNNDYTSG